MARTQCELLHDGSHLGQTRNRPATRVARGETPYVFADLMRLQGVSEVIAFLARVGGMPTPSAMPPQDR